MSRNTDLSAASIVVKSNENITSLDFEHRILITSNTTFVPPAAATAIRFTAVGGGGNGSGYTSGAGAGLFQKTIYGPWTGTNTNFQLTIGAAEGITTLANCAGTSIAKAFGATAISGPNPVGVGGTSCGGDLNTSGSPGGQATCMCTGHLGGVGGASGGLIADSIYDETYAGRWAYFKESISNENVKNYVLNSFYLSGGTATAIGLGTAGDYIVLSQVIDGIQPSSASLPAGLFTSGAPGTASNNGCNRHGVPGGYGGDGGYGAQGIQQCTGNPTTCTVGGNGGNGGYGGNGGCGGRYQVNQPYAFYIQGCRGGDGGYAGSGGTGGLGCCGCLSCGEKSSISGLGGCGGFGGAGGQGGSNCNPACTNKAGCGGVGGFGGGGGAGGSGFVGNGNGGNGGYGGGGGAVGYSVCCTAWVNCTNISAGSGGTGAVIVEWTTKPLTN